MSDSVCFLSKIKLRRISDNNPKQQVSHSVKRIVGFQLSITKKHLRKASSKATSKTSHTFKINNAKLT